MTDLLDPQPSEASTSPGLASAQARSTHYRYAVLMVLMLVYAFNFLDRQILSILNEPIKNELRLSDSEMGLLQGLAFALFYTTFGIPIAWLADRFNRVRIIAISCALWSLCSAACGLVGNFAQLALARIGVGVGEAGGSPPAHSIISDYFAPSERGMALAIYSMGIAIGPAMGAAVGGWVAAHWGWRMAFFAAGLPGILVALIVLTAVREPQRARLDSAQSQLLAVGKVGLIEVVRDFAKNPALGLTALATGLCAFIGYGFGAWVPAMLIRTKGMNLSEIAIYYSIASGILTAAGTLGSGALVDWAGKRSAKVYALLPAFAFALSLPFFLATLVAHTWQGALAFLTVPLLLTNTFLAPALAVVQNSVPANRRSVASALLFFVLNLIGLGGGPLFVGFVSDESVARFGQDSLLVGLAALAPFFLLTVGVLLLSAKYLDRPNTGPDQSGTEVVPGG
jgi:MFS family permease